MRQVYPSNTEVLDLRHALHDFPTVEGRPSVRIVMVQSVDGVAVVDGASGGLGGDADRAVFLANRSLADVVLVGASTVRTEGYGPARLNPELTAARRAEGRSDVPRIAVVTRNLAFDFDAPFFRDATARPIIVTVDDAPSPAVARARTVADVVIAGSGSVDLHAALTALAGSGARRLVCEGGPTLNAQLVVAGLVDELCLSVSPIVIGGDAPRIVSTLEPLDRAMSLHAMYVADGFVFVRYRVRSDIGHR